MLSLVYLYKKTCQGLGFYDKIKLMLNRNIKRTIAALLLLLVLIAVFNFTGFSANIKNFFFCISSPIQKSFWQGGKNVSDFLSGVLDAGTLKKETEGLRLENKELLARIAILSELEKENEVLKQALEIGLEKEPELILARVTSKDISQDSVLVNKGEKDGVAEGMIVITGQKILLGRVGSVYNSFSEIVLISNKDSSFGARIPGRDIDGVIRGRGSSNLSLDLIPREKEIFENDVVITSVLGGVYPQGLLVGQVKTIKKSDVDPFQSAEIKPAIEINGLDYLFIIR